MQVTQDRRWFLSGLLAIGAITTFGSGAPFAAEGPPLRATLKVTDLRVAEPQRGAQRLVEGGFTGRCEYAFQALAEVPYDRWREYDPADTLRFYALPLHEAGMITASPNQTLTESTEGRFLDGLKRELKA